MLKKSLLALSVVALASGCSVTPNVITPQSLETTALSDIERLAQEQAVEAAISLDEAIARAVLNNRDKKLKSLEAALAQGQIDLVRHEMLPELTASAGYSKRSEYAASASVNFTDGEPDALGPNPAYSVSQGRERDT